MTFDKRELSVITITLPIAVIILFVIMVCW